MTIVATVTGDSFASDLDGLEADALALLRRAAERAARRIRAAARSSLPRDTGRLVSGFRVVVSGRERVRIDLRVVGPAARYWPFVQRRRDVMLLVRRFEAMLAQSLEQELKSFR